MDYSAIFERIRQTVDEASYQTPVDHLEPGVRDAVAQVRRALAVPDFDADHVRGLVHRLEKDGRLDRVMALSCLHVIAAHPRVREYEEAARLVGEQELAALQAGGRHLPQRLAAVDRHRGVLAFVNQSYEVALDYFARALERERSAENLTNVLCTLLRLGDEDEALQLLRQVRQAFPEALVRQVDDNIASDPDLALLRMEASP